MKTKEKKLLTLLCDVFQGGHAEQLEPHLAEDCFYHSQYSKRESYGPQEVLDIMEAVCIGVDDSCRYFPSLVLTEHTVVSCRNLPQSYCGKHCIRLCQGTPDNLVAFVFLRLNEDDQICEIFFARNNVYLREFVGRDIDRKEVFQKTVCAGGLTEYRLYLNEKTYVYRTQYRKDSKVTKELDTPLEYQISSDYRQYEDFEDFNGYNMRYGDLVFFVSLLSDGGSPEYLAKRIGEYENYHLICEGAKPATPGEPIPEIEEFLFRVTYLRDGSVVRPITKRSEEMFTQRNSLLKAYIASGIPTAIMLELVEPMKYMAEEEKEVFARNLRLQLENGEIDLTSVTAIRK